jgi:hypothetical protein
MISKRTDQSSVLHFIVWKQQSQVLSHVIRALDTKEIAAFGQFEDWAEDF